MGSTRQEQFDLDDEWVCPHCDANDGIEICELTPVYSSATPWFDGGRWHAKYGEAVGDIFWDGADKPIVYCLNCRAELNMEVIW